jgi:hypothetical protein
MVSAMAATLHRLADVFDPVEASAFTDAQRASILREARALAAEPRSAPRPAPLPQPADPVARWRAEADAMQARERAELERDKREQRQWQRQQQRQQVDATMAWHAHLELRLESERGFMAEVMGTVVAELQARIAALETQLRELKR